MLWKPNGIECWSKTLQASSGCLHLSELGSENRKTPVHVVENVCSYGGHVDAEGMSSIYSFSLAAP